MLGDLDSQSKEITRLDDEKHSLLKKLDYFKKCVLAGVKGEKTVATSENDVFTKSALYPSVNSQRY